MSEIRFMALGGGREIGANSFYYDIDGHGLLIDAGLHPEKTGWEAFPLVKHLGEHTIDSFIVTHAHTDHLGAVPFIVQKKNPSRVLASEETIELARIMLANSASLLPKQHPDEVLRELTNYSLEGIADVISQLEPFSLGSTATLRKGTPEKAISASFYQSGHILGAGGILIETNGTRIFHTGDTSLHEQRLIASAELPKGHVDILVTESTNGLTDAYLTHSRELELERLLETLNATIAQGGSILIPVFALGKLQEMLSTLWDAMTDGRLPKVDIYTGGMGRRISDVYDQFKTSSSRTRVDDSLIDIPQKELPRRDGLFNGKYFREPSIVLAASGMMQEGTASYLLAQRWLRESNFALCFVGYTDPRTPGFIVSHAKRGDRIRFGSMRRDVPVRCTVERFRFSAHARRDELLMIVDRLRPKHVVLTHGDEQAMSAFGGLILETFPGTVVSAPELGKWYRLTGDRSPD